MESNVLYKHLRTSHWMYIHTCLSCGYNLDDEGDDLVCPECGGIAFDKKVGRWHSYERRLSLWQDFLQALGLIDDNDFRSEVEFKEPSRG